MPMIANLTLAQLRAATKTQIITAISNHLTNNFTKRQLVAFLLDADTVSDPPAVTFNQDGQIESETTTMEDAETGQVLSTRCVDWTYYPSGEVDAITVQEGETVRIIQHYLDGTQPTVSIRTAAVQAAAPVVHQPFAIWKWVVAAACILGLLLLTCYFTR